MFGLNDHPDQLSGRLYVTVGVPAIGDTFGTITSVTVNSSVAAVPEPSTYALSFVGLTAVAFAARRRRLADTATGTKAPSRATA